MLSERSKRIRRDTIHLSKANGGYHYGGCFSIVEILIALYDFILTDQDKFILSKGHSCWPLYVILRERGLNPALGGHPERDPYNGIHYTTGSLGHGFPAAVGMAMAWKIRGIPGKIYVLMGDGETQEGTTWESLLIAKQYKLDNLIVIVDTNGIQGSGRTSDILDFNFSDVTDSLGFETWVCNGHDISMLNSCLKQESKTTKIIIAQTIKGRGVSFMEDDPAWHACWPSPDYEKQAFEELA